MPTTLSSRQVKEIYTSTEIPKKLAGKHGIRVDHVYRILNQQCWKRVTAGLKLGSENIPATYNDENFNLSETLEGFLP